MAEAYADTAVDIDDDDVSSVPESLEQLDEIEYMDDDEHCHDNFESKNASKKTNSFYVTLSNVKIRILEKLNLEQGQDDVDGDELASTLPAKIIAIIVAAFCGVFVGFSAFMEARLASKISDPWMRRSRIRNSYVISIAGIFLGACVWTLAIWLITVYES